MLIELSKLSHIYMKDTPMEVEVLKGIDLTIAQGEFVAVIGKTGSGKSTLIQHLNGIIKPTSGEVFYEGKNIWSKNVDIRQVRRNVGLVFQYPEHQMFEETVHNEIAFGPKNMGLSKEELEESVIRAMEFVGLNHEEYKDRSPFELSGGQKRRVAIASVLAMEPKVLVLDEPTAGMDPRGRDEIMQKIRSLHDERGYTIVLVSHSMEEVAEYAKRICVVDDGRIVIDGATREVFKEVERLKELGLGVPQVTELIHMLYAESYLDSFGVINVDEAVDEIIKAYKLKVGDI